MGIISKGILGGFSGLVGTVVGGNWNGIDYMRSKPTKRSAASYSPAQVDQQLKFGVAMRFLQSLGELPEHTFHRYAVQKTGRNIALSHLLKHAITGDSPAFTIDYSKVLVSRGNLAMAPGAAAALGVANRVNFTWTNNTGLNGAKDSDKAIVVVHCPMLNTSLYDLATTTRSAEAASLDASLFYGQTVHTWIGFISEDGKEVASSLYTGSLVVS